MEEDDRPVILWDGGCGFCRRCMAWVKRQDHHKQWRDMPFQDMPSPPMTPDLYRRCQRALHIRFHNGYLLHGGVACLYILDTLGYHHTAKLLRRWPLVWLVTIGYWLVARQRQFFSRFLWTRE